MCAFVKCSDGTTAGGGGCATYLPGPNGSQGCCWTGASDGFILLGGSSFDRIRDDVLPGLVDRGVFARDHAGATLRERLGTSTPGLPDGEVSRAAG